MTADTLTTVDRGIGSGPGADGRVARAFIHLRRPQVAFGVSVALLWVCVVASMDLWAPYSPYVASGPPLASPTAAHWLGTDALGRDVLVRTLYGARQSLPVAAAVICCAVAIGSLLGAIAGYVGRWVDAVIMRVVDVTFAFPPILLAMAVAAALGPGLWNGFVAMVVVWWPIYARLLRAQVLSVKNREHVEAAVSVGATRPRIMRRHVLPLSFTPVLINATMDFGLVVLLTASLSFLGLGALPPSPEWGAMITEGSKYFYQWWIAVAPGVAIFSIVMASNFLGDALRDALDPREAGR